MMARNLIESLEDEIAGRDSAEPWLAGLVQGMRSIVASDEAAGVDSLITETAMIARETPASIGAAPRRRRTMVWRLRRGLVLNTAVVLSLLVGSAALAVTATRSGSAPEPIRAVVDQVAEWAGFQRISPPDLPDRPQSEEPDVQTGESAPPPPTSEPPGNRGETTGPPPNANNSGNGNSGDGGQSEGRPGNQGSGIGPPATSNAGGNAGNPNAGNNQGSSSAGDNARNPNAGDNPGNSNAGGKS